MFRGQSEIVGKMSSAASGIPRDVKENFALDKAETLIRYAVFLSGTDSQKAGQLFRTADVLLKPFQQGNDPRSRMCFERAQKMRSQIPEKEKTK